MGNTTSYRPLEGRRWLLALTLWLSWFAVSGVGGQSSLPPRPVAQTELLLATPSCTALAAPAQQQAQAAALHLPPAPRVKHCLLAYARLVAVQLKAHGRAWAGAPRAGDYPLPKSFPASGKDPVPVA